MPKHRSRPLCKQYQCQPVWINVVSPRYEPYMRVCLLAAWLILYLAFCSPRPTMKTRSSQRALLSETCQHHCAAISWHYRKVILDQPKFIGLTILSVSVSSTAYLDALWRSSTCAGLFRRRLCMTARQHLRQSILDTIQRLIDGIDIDPVLRSIHNQCQMITRYQDVSYSIFSQAKARRHHVTRAVASSPQLGWSYALAMHLQDSDILPPQYVESLHGRHPYTTTSFHEHTRAGRARCGSIPTCMRNPAKGQWREMSHTN